MNDNQKTILIVGALLLIAGWSIYWWNLTTPAGPTLTPQHRERWAKARLNKLK